MALSGINYASQVRPQYMDTQHQMAPASWTDYLVATAIKDQKPGLQRIVGDGRIVGDEPLHAKGLALGRAANKTRELDVLIEMLAMMKGEKGQRGVPATNPSQGRGYNLQGGSSEQLGQATLRPLPFDQHYGKQANFMTLVKSMPPELYQKSEGIRNMITQLAPAAVENIFKPASILDGVPRDYYQNRVNIFLQRKRENDVYALV